MPKKLIGFGESILELKEAFCEEELLAASHHKRVEHTVLLLRNLAVAAASVLFFVSLFHVPCRYLLKAIAYFLGAAAYFGEILLLTDCFTQKVPRREMFMAYCFGPMYILLGVSYLVH